MTAVIVLLVLVAVLWLYLFFSPAHKVFFDQPLNARTPLPDPPAWPGVTVVVPARNEAAMLPATVPTICGQDYPEFRVVVVDDQSDDATPEILDRLRAAHPNLVTVRAADRPAGWCGKPWAVTQGVRHPELGTRDSELLLFTDADIEYHPHALRQAVRLLASGPYDCVSLFPQLFFSSLSEKIGLTGLVTLLALGYPAGVVNDPKSKHALAAGAFILVRRAAYASIGGHEAVRNEIIEDLNLARQLKAAGARLHIRLTDDLITTRMYEDFADMWEGLAKNAFAGMEYRPHRFLTGAPLLLAFAVFPPVYLVVAFVAALATYPATPKLWAVVALCVLINLLMVLVHRRTIRHFRLPPVHAYFMPLSLGLYLVIVAGSILQYYSRGGTVWKGRRYHRDALAPPPAPGS